MLIAVSVVQMQRGMWMMTPPHGGYMHQAYGPLHGRYLHGLMADGTSCERFVPDSCYFVPGQSVGYPASGCAQALPPSTTKRPMQSVCGSKYAALHVPCRAQAAMAAADTRGASDIRCWRGAGGVPLPSWGHLHGPAWPLASTVRRLQSAQSVLTLRANTAGQVYWWLAPIVMRLPCHSGSNASCQVFVTAAEVLAAASAGPAHLWQRRLLREGRPAGRLCRRALVVLACNV